MKLTDYVKGRDPEEDSLLTPYGLRQIEQEKKMRELEQKAAEVEMKERNSMKNKLCKIAELFEMDVLSEEEALKACNTVIHQHAKVKIKGVNGGNDAKV